MVAQFCEVYSMLDVPRIKEATSVMQDGDSKLLKEFCAKFNINVAALEKLTNSLSEAVDTDESSILVTETTLEECSELIMGAGEVTATLELELGTANIRNAVMQSEKIEREKIEREIEKLKVETEYKRSKMEQLKNVDSSDKKDNVKSKLPTVTLPTFSGKIIEWPSFCDAFDSTIHSNTNNSKIDKFKYLLSAAGMSVGEHSSVFSRANINL